MLPYVDINSAMVDIADLHRERIINACLKSIKEKELDFALSLLAKHGKGHLCLLLALKNTGNGGFREKGLTKM